MKFFATLATIALAASRTLAQGQLTINTPANPVVCQPLLLTWSGGTEPYFLVRTLRSLREKKFDTILPGNQPGAQALHDFGQVSGNSLTWIVNIAAGTSIGLTLRDSTGNTAQSAAFAINAGTNTDCVGKDPSTSGAPTTAGNTTSGPAGSTTPTTPAGTTTTPTTPAIPATTAPATTAPATTPAATTPRPSSASSLTVTSARPSSTNAAPTQAAGFGAAAFLGAAAVAIFA
ncbi:hypothetical protein DXG01_004180 [Tephrocybe rancida]|nr:hypothetical protein DXG01_004180 [Tephrocybe rancida]